MKFTAPASDLANVLGYVKGIVPARTTIPILNHVMIRATKGGVHVTATDMAMEATAFLPCDVQKPGDTTVPGHALFGIAKAFKAKDAVFSLEGHRVTLSSGRTQYDFGAIPIDEFPVMPPVDDAEGEITCDASEIKACLEDAATSAAVDDNRAFLNGVFMHLEKRRLAFVGADGHKFSRVYMDSDAKAFPEIIVPHAALKEIVGILSIGGEATIRASKRRIEVKTDAASITALLIDADYPDYKAIVPEFDEPAATVTCGELAEAIDRLLIIYSGLDVRAPCAHLSGSDGHVKIVGGRTGGKGQEVIDADVATDFDFACNARYLSDLIKRWSKDARVQMSPDRLGRAVRLTSPDYPDHMHIIMTMAVHLATADATGIAA